MEAVSAYLNWFLQPISSDLSKPQKKLLRDGLVGLLRAGRPVACRTACTGERSSSPAWTAWKEAACVVAIGSCGRRWVEGRRRDVEVRHAALRHPQTMKMGSLGKLQNTVMPILGAVIPGATEAQSRPRGPARVVSVKFCTRDSASPIRSSEAGLMRREGWIVNLKRVYRLCWQEECLKSHGSEV